MHISTNIWVWVAAALTLCIYSFLYKDNPFYKFAEHLFVGVSAGYIMVMEFTNNIIPNLWNPLFVNHFDEKGRLVSCAFYQLFHDGRWNIGLLTLLPGLLGLMVLARLLPKVGWVSRWPLAFYFGAYQGLAIIGAMQAWVLAQVFGTLVTQGNPVFSLALFSTATQHPGWTTVVAAVSGPLMIVGVIATLTYFFFSTEHKGVVGGVAKVGIVYLMVGFGASFGYTVMARVSLLIGRIHFLLADWLGVVT
jgi:hypothetical protein